MDSTLQKGIIPDRERTVHLSHMSFVSFEMTCKNTGEKACLQNRYIFCWDHLSVVVGYAVFIAAWIKPKLSSSSHLPRRSCRFLE